MLLAKYEGPAIFIYDRVKFRPHSPEFRSILNDLLDIKEQFQRKASFEELSSPSVITINTFLVCVAERSILSAAVTTVS